MERTEDAGLPQPQEGGRPEPRGVLHRRWMILPWPRFWQNPQHFRRVSPRRDAKVSLFNGAQPVKAPTLFPA